MTAPALPTPDFSRFPRHAELTALLRAYARGAIVKVDARADRAGAVNATILLG